MQASQPPHAMQDCRCEGGTCCECTIISWPRPVAEHREAATREAMRCSGSVTIGQPPHSTSQPVVCALHSGVSKNTSATPARKHQCYRSKVCHLGLEDCASSVCSDASATHAHTGHETSINCIFRLTRQTRLTPVLYALHVCATLLKQKLDALSKASSSEGRQNQRGASSAPERAMWMGLAATSVKMIRAGSMPRAAASAFTCGSPYGGKRSSHSTLRGARTVLVRGCRHFKAHRIFC